MQSPAGERKGLEEAYLLPGQARKSSVGFCTTKVPSGLDQKSQQAKERLGTVSLSLNYAGQLGNFIEKSGWYLRSRQSSHLISLDRKNTGRAGHWQLWQLGQ